MIDDNAATSAAAPMTVEEIDRQIAELDRMPYHAWTAHTADQKFELMHRRGEAVKAEHAQGQARRAALVAQANALTPAPAPGATTTDVDRQLEALDGEWQKNFARLADRTHWLPPDQKAQLIDRQLDITREQNALKAQRDGIVQANTAAKAFEAPLHYPEFPWGSGYTFKPARVEAVRAAAVTEDPVLARFVQDSLPVIVSAVDDIRKAQQLGEPFPTPETAEPIWRGAWGAAYEDKLELASEAWVRFQATCPKEAADITKSGVRYTIRWANLMAAAGEALFDPRTERGMARRMAKLASEE